MMEKIWKVWNWQVLNYWLQKNRKKEWFWFVEIKLAAVSGMGFDTYFHRSWACYNCSQYWWCWCSRALANWVASHQTQCLLTAQLPEWDSSHLLFQWHSSKLQQETLLSLSHCQPEQAMAFHLPKLCQVLTPKSVTSQNQSSTHHTKEHKWELHSASIMHAQWFSIAPANRRSCCFF